MKRTSGLALLSTLSLLAGCGGGSPGGGSPLVPKGAAVLNVVWPPRDRQIPVAANSLKVTLSLNGAAVASQTIARPAAGTTSTSTNFPDLPIGSLGVAVSAFPNADGTGVAQAMGTGTMAVASGTPGAVTVSLVSTVASLAVTPSALHIGKGSTGTISASALDAAGNIVLLATSGSEPIAWTSSAPTILSVSGTGPTASLSGLLTGTATITARFVTDDAGDALTASTGLTVVAGSGTVTIR